MQTVAVRGFIRNEAVKKPIKLTVSARRSGVGWREVDRWVFLEYTFGGRLPSRSSILGIPLEPRAKAAEVEDLFWTLTSRSSPNSMPRGSRQSSPRCFLEGEW